jgi:hypothetical protein
MSPDIAKMSPVEAKSLYPWLKPIALFKVNPHLVKSVGSQFTKKANSYKANIPSDQFKRLIKEFCFSG